MMLAQDESLNSAIYTEVVVLLRFHGPTCAAVCKASADLIVNLTSGDDSTILLRDAGACEGACG